MAQGRKAPDSEISAAVKDWVLLKDQRPHTRTSQACKSRIGRVLGFLGLPYQNEQQLTLQEEGRSGSRWIYLTLQVDPQEVESVRGVPNSDPRRMALITSSVSGKMRDPTASEQIEPLEGWRKDVTMLSFSSILRQ